MIVSRIQLERATHALSECPSPDDGCVRLQNVGLIIAELKARDKAIKQGLPLPEMAATVDAVCPYLNSGRCPQGGFESRGVGT